MFQRRSAFAASLVFAVLVPGHGAWAADDVFGFDYCAPPRPPPCVTQESTYPDPARSKACELDLNRFIASAFAYRECLARESERAVTQANITIQKFRCSSQAKQLCP